MIIGTDFHVHPWKDFNKPLANGSSTRLEDTLRPFDVMLKLALKLGLRRVYSLGDVFHKRNTIYTATFNRAYAKIRQFPEKQIEFVSLTGNHDQSTRDGKLHSLEAFKDIATIIDEFGFIMDGSVMVWTLPYVDDPAQVKKHLYEIKKTAVSKSVTKKVLLGHLGVQGATAGPYEFQPLEQIKPEDFDGLGLDAVLLGHYHDPQNLSTKGTMIRYMGAPIHHSREDSKSDIRGIHYGNPDFSVFVTTPVDETPRFRTLSGKTFDHLIAQDKKRLSVLLKNHYVTVDYDPNTFDPDKAAAELAVASITPAGIMYRAVAPKTRLASTRQVISSGIDDDQIIDEYINLTPPPQGLDAKKVVLAGRKLLED